MPVLKNIKAIAKGMSITFMEMFNRRRSRTIRMGLGLCVVKSFVELHGGKVECWCNPGEGTTFSFTIPRRSP